MLITDDEGVIVDLGFPEDLAQRFPDLHVERLQGLLVPGFINTHCHLELSCMKGQITRHTGMAGFVSEFVSKRAAFTDQERAAAIVKAEDEMLRNGTVAVGDISNGNSTFSQKAKKRLYYQTFIETFDLAPSRAPEAFDRACLLREELIDLMPETRHQVSIVPHAPYTVSPELHKLIATYARRHQLLLSIHNQESRAEDELFRTGTGKLMEMYERMGLDYSWFKARGESSIHSTLPFYKDNDKLLLVHNTYTAEDDLLFAAGAETKASRQKPLLFWATCPNANLYIEDRLPNYTALLKHNLRITIGTDSLASNSTLSVLDELKTVAHAHPEIPVDVLLRWATLNGAEFLGIDRQYGSFEMGKKPGVALIEGAGPLAFSGGWTSRRIL